MLVYRISTKKYIHDLSGMGAALHGGRWNPKGLPMLYTSGSISLATLEYLVHNFHLLKTLQVCMATIRLPAKLEFIEQKMSQLPEQWNRHPESLAETKILGQNFLTSGKQYAMKVPSAIVPGEFNILLNPMHQLHATSKMVEIMDPFRFDDRLLQL